MIKHPFDYDAPNPSPVAMPRIDTSSDMYQNRDLSLTTYKKSLDHAVVYKDLPRPDEKQRVREVQKDVTAIKNQDIIKGSQQGSLAKTAFVQAEQSKLVEQERARSLNPPLYEPRKAPPDRPVDASSFITGGTVDVRA
jgi:hypothetical protein